MGINKQNNFKSIIQIVLVIILILSMIQILPNEVTLINRASASSSWVDTDWSNSNNYSVISGLFVTLNYGELQLPYGRAIYVADIYNHRIVKTTMDGSMWTTYGSQGSGTGQFSQPYGICHDNTTGFIYVADYLNCRIVKTKINGSGWTTYGSLGSGIGQFKYPTGISYDSSTGYIYVADSNNHRIVKTKMDGTGWTTYGSYGSGTGQWNFPRGICYDSNSGYIYVTDYNNYRIVKTKIDGTGWTTYGTMGTGKGQFNHPVGLFYDNTTEYLYVTDHWNSRIVKTMMNGTGWTTYGSQGSGKGEFYGPNGIFYDNDTGYVYVPDMQNNRIVKTMMNGSGWTTYGSYGFGKGQFYCPSGITLGEGSYYLCLDGYLSSIHYNCNGTANFTTLSWSGTTPPGTLIKFQLRTANSSSGLTMKAFVGPDGSINTYYTNNGAKIWSGHDGGKWVQYKVYLSTNNNTRTPVLSDVTIDYNLLPNQPTHITPINNSWINYNTPNFTWQHNDTDSGGQIGYQWQIDDDIGFNTIDFDSNNVSSSKSSYSQFSSLPDGIWYWRIRTKDSDGDWGPYSSPWKFCIDTKPPNSTILIPENNKFYNNLSEISGIAYDQTNGIGVDKVEISIKRLSDDHYWNGLDWILTESWLLTNGTSDWIYNSSLVTWTSNTQYQVISRAFDKLTNMEHPVNSVTFNFDSEKPTSKIEYPLNNGFLNDLPIIYGNSIDTGGAGVKQVEICINKTNNNQYWTGSVWSKFKTWLTVNGTDHWTFDSSSIPWLSDTKYIISSKATDNISNIEIPNDDCIFNFDNDLPSSSIDFPINNSFLNDLNSIFGHTIDFGGSEIDRVEISIQNLVEQKYWDGASWDSTEYWLQASGKHNWSFDATKVPWLTDNYYTIRSRAIDMAKNIEIVSSEVTIMYDNKSPELSIVINNDDRFTNTTSVVLSIHSEDTGSGVAEMALSTDGIEWSEWMIFNEEILFELPDVDSEKVVYIKAQDRVGNIGGPFFDSIILDTTPPKIMSIQINDDARYTNSNNVTLNLSATDSLSGISEMSLSNNLENWTSWEPFNSKRSFTLLPIDGKKSIYFKVIDKAGNIAVATDTIILDTTPPNSLSITVTKLGSEPNSKLFILDLRAFDNLSGVYQMSFSGDGITWDAWEHFIENKYYMISTGDDVKFIFFKVSDMAGNIADPVFVQLSEVGDESESEPDTNSFFTEFWNIIFLVIILIIIIALVIFIIKRKKQPDQSEEESNPEEAVTVKPGTIPSAVITVGELQAAPSKPQLPETNMAIGSPHITQSTLKIATIATSTTPGQVPEPKQIPQVTQVPKLPSAQPETSETIEESNEKATPTLDKPMDPQKETDQNSQEKN